MKNFFLKTFLLSFLFSCTVWVYSQNTKPTLQKEDYDQWQSIRAYGISPDGSWINYSIRPVEGNDTMYIKSARGEKLYSLPFGSGLAFSEDSKWAAVRIGYSDKETKKKKKKKEAVRYKMKLLNLTTGEEVLFEDIQSFRFSEDATHLGMKMYSPEKSKNPGSDLLLRNLKTGTTRNIGNVSEWGFNKKGDRLAYIIATEKKLGNGVELFDLGAYKVHVLASDTSTFRKLVWERKGRALAFMQTWYDTLYEEASHKIYAFRDAYQPSDKIIVDPVKIVNFPDSMRIKESFTPRWSDDLSSIFFGIHDWTKKEQKEKKQEDNEENDKKESKKEADDEKLPGVDIWHWKDDPIQPRQKRTHNTDKNFTHLSVWHFNEKKFVRLSHNELDRGRLTGDQKHYYYYDVKPYMPQFRASFADHYIVDTKTGDKRPVLKNHLTDFYTSPAGKYILYFKDNNWFVYDIAASRHRNLTETIDVPFWNVRYDLPMDIKPPFGNGGWLKGDEKVYLYDEYDVWAVNPDGSGAEKITSGRENQIIYRIRKLDHEEPWLDPAQPLYFSMFGDKTKYSGFARLTIKGKLEQLHYNASSNSRLAKAKSAGTFIFVSNTYTDSPDLFVVDAKFKKPVQITSTNPQQEKFAWGKTELISFLNADGKELQGVLHYPANYEAGKKYPMLVYIYEIRSNSLNNYINPSRKSFYNITNYVQQGYFVFQPDIVYKTNHPGESAVDCVVPAVQKVLKTGMIDESKLGIMGHSWGAYQTSFIITQTGLFSAAVAGAPLTNMISMYNSIYWNSGTPDQTIFETSQGRLREPYWNLMEEYINNSPIFQALNIKTPILVAFGDEDGAVDWHQGIEFYITMRRMEKPMIMLVYAGENHSVRKDENMLDYTRKINEFFDHYLLGKPAKTWIETGVSYLDKQKAESRVKKKK